MWYKLTTSGHCYLFIEAIPTEFQFTISFRYRHKEKLNEKKKFTSGNVASSFNFISEIHT